jgi:preprotein translocase subunit SecA
MSAVATLAMTPQQPGGGSSRDATLARQLAGATFRRADTLRDERGIDRDHVVERFLRNVQGLWPPGAERASATAALAARIESAQAALRGQPDEAVAEAFAQAQQALKAGRRGLRDHAAMARVLACAGEASRRRLGLVPHPVQWSGVCTLLSGRLAEMRTGEGKTLVAALAACVMAGSGAAVHVVSTNDYLAERDSTEMSPLLAFFGLRCAFVRGGMDPAERRDAYAAPVCYVAGKELVFDYLKDRLAGHGVEPVPVARLRCLAPRPAAAEAASGEPLLPALHYAIVDEADSVLIDEARTPMILSRDAPGLLEPELLAWAVDAARGLVAGRHFLLLGNREVELRDAALAATPPVPATVRPVWRARSWRELLLRQALTALHLFHRDQHYIVVDSKVQIVDESTGRTMPDRSWEQGLHQLIEVKEGLEPTPGRETLARMTFQRFFRRYYLLAGLTGTAAEASRELWAVYGLAVRRIPTHRPEQRLRQPDACLPDAAAKWRAVVDDAAAAAARGQPVLVGTRSVEASEQVAAELQRRGLTHVVLNARQDAEEAAIVAAAGAAGRITVATNMAGRGTDIKPEPAALAAGGLHVILTEFHESRRVDRQLVGRAARQGQPGSARAIVAAGDPLFHRFGAGSSRLLAALPGVLRRALLPLAVWHAQTRAEWKERRSRLQTLKQDRELPRMIGFSGSLR